MNKSLMILFYCLFLSGCGAKGALKLPSGPPNDSNKNRQPEPASEPRQLIEALATAQLNPVSLALSGASTKRHKGFKQ